MALAESRVITVHIIIRYLEDPRFNYLDQHLPSTSLQPSRVQGIKRDGAASVCVRTFRLLYLSLSPEPRFTRITTLRTCHVTMSTYACSMADVLATRFSFEKPRRLQVK